MPGRSNKSPVDILTDADFENPESRFRALELALVETANCVKETYNQQTEHQQIVEASHKTLTAAIKANTDAINENALAIGKNSTAVKMLNRMIFAVFGAVIVGALTALADKIWSIF